MAFVYGRFGVASPLSRRRPPTGFARQSHAIIKAVITLYYTGMHFCTVITGKNKLDP